MNANEAKRLSNKAKDEGTNYQRNFILGRIKTAAYLGDTHIVLSFTDIHLYEEDYLYFEKLGYKVIRPVVKYFLPKGVEISENELTLNLTQGQCYRDVKYGTISW